ncbi:RDD family protein [Enterococcus canintestini]|uniref:RDD domain-containing protein n=1 Tax=Enterococcus canintestini TaxID=317010 RepID=A0A267HSU5_9ENTE|nr:RDD family protein [Enterococcus canintestini]PAB01429.1 hypothetical protein AKL21_05370 [Enterococcus canintestini]
MKYLLFIQRILATMIDLIIVYIPISFIVNVVVTGYFTPTILSGVLFTIYSVVAIHSFQGQTIGKYFAKIQVIDVGKSMMNDSIREVIKLIYFIPFLGLIVGGLSIGCYFIQGKFLHDIIGKSKVSMNG